MVYNSFGYGKLLLHVMTDGGDAGIFRMNENTVSKSLSGSKSLSLLSSSIFKLAYDTYKNDVMKGNTSAFRYTNF